MKARYVLASVLLVAVAGMIAGGLLAADPKPALSDAKCPVTGKPINTNDWVAFENGKVYFCCENCPAAFKKDTAKYAAKAHLQMVQTGQLKEVACPLTGKPLNPSTAIDVGGVQVAFCCNTCKGKVEKATGDEKISMVFKDVSKGYKPAAEAK